MERPPWLSGGTSARIAAVVFVLVGVPALAVGVLDSLTALDIGYRLLGLAFTVAGIDLLVAASCLALPGLTMAWGRPAGLSAALVGMALGLYLLANQLGAPQGGRLLLWSLVVLASASCLLLLPPGGTPAASGDPGGARTRPRSVLARLLASAGVSLTFVGGFLQFWYSNDYVPSTVGAALTIAARMDYLGRSDGLVVAAADITLRNATNTRVQVVSSLFTVTSSPIAAQANITDGAFDSASADALQTPAEALTPYSVASRYARAGPGQVVETGRVVPDDWSFEPGEEYSGRLTVYAPDELAGQVLHLFVDVVVAKGTHLWLADRPSYGPRQVPSSIFRYEVSEWPIQRLSYIRELTRGDQAATIVVLLDEPAAEAAAERRRLPGLFVCIDRLNRMNDALAEQVDRLCPGTQQQHDLAVFYGILRTFAASDLPLPSAPAS